MMFPRPTLRDLMFHRGQSLVDRYRHGYRGLEVPNDRSRWVPVVWVAALMVATVAIVVSLS